jgi:putative DNA primase/helicase
MRLATEFGQSPVWALLSAGQVARFPVLSGVEALWIAVDHDRTGIEAARECARRWKATGRDVFLIRSKTEGDDLNDIIRRRACA